MLNRLAAPACDRQLNLTIVPGWGSNMDIDKQAAKSTRPAVDGLHDHDAIIALYRREALEAATSRFGAPVRPMGLNAAALTCFFSALFIAVAIFFAMGRYTRKETVAGIVQPSTGAIRVAPIASGVISDVFVSEGQLVASGSPIFKFTADPTVSVDGAAPTALSQLVTAGAEREALAMAAQGEAQVVENLRSLQHLRSQESGLLADRNELEQSLTLQRERIRLAQETVDAGRALNERKLFSDLQLRQREEALITAKQGAGSLQRELRQNNAALDQIKAETGQFQARTDRLRADMQRSQAQFDQRRAEQLASKATMLIAGQSGRVTAVQIRPGTLVHAGQTLAIIIPKDTKFQAELWIPSRAAGFVEIGSSVRLMYDAFPFQKYGVGHGRVISIAGAPTNPGDLLVPIETKEALYRVVVDIDDEGVRGYDRRWRLAPGMRLSADVVLDERSLWEWLLDPIIAARRRSGN